MKTCCPVCKSIIEIREPHIKDVWPLLMVCFLLGGLLAFFGPQIIEALA